MRYPPLINPHAHQSHSNSNPKKTIAHHRPHSS
jgi:hypothetical protein